MSSAEPVEPAVGYVQSLARGLAVIRAFDESHPEMTLSEVARATELSRAATRALDKAASKGVIHKNQAANRKSTIMKRLNSDASA